MKRVFCCFSVVLIILLLVLPAFASAPEAGEGSSTITETPDVNLYNSVTIDQTPGIYLGSSVSYAASYSGSGSGLKGVLIDFLGDWETIVVEHSYQDADGNFFTVHETQPDYPWLCSAALLCLMIFCLFRLGGAILCKT